jgi:hypothetical protein
MVAVRHRRPARAGTQTAQVHHSGKPPESSLLGVCGWATDGAPNSSTSQQRQKWPRGGALHGGVQGWPATDAAPQSSNRLPGIHTAPTSPQQELLRAGRGGPPIVVAKETNFQLRLLEHSRA